MAKYEVTFSCGHTHTVQLYGKTANREQKIKWMEEEADCPDCYKAKLAAERETATAKAKEEAENAGFPALTGTEKQIAWAETLRNKALMILKENMDELTLPQYDNGAEIVKRATRKVMAQAAKLHTDSRYWIDHRDELPSHVWRTLGKEAFEALGGAEKMISDIQTEIAKGGN